MRQSSDHLTLDWYPMLVNLAVERLTERDDVTCAFGAVSRGCGRTPMLSVKPEPELIEEMESRPINGEFSLRRVFGPEKDRCGEESLKALHDPPVVGTIVRELEKIEHLGSTLKPNDATFLLQCEGRDPNWNEAILSEGEAKIRVSDYFKEEFAAVPAMDKLVFGRAAERNPTKNERTGIIGKLLCSLFALLTDELDRIESFQPSLSDSNIWAEGTE